MTIRRDTTALANANLMRRVHAGVVILDRTTSPVIPALPDGDTTARSLAKPIATTHSASDGCGTRQG